MRQISPRTRRYSVTINLKPRREDSGQNHITFSLENYPNGVTMNSTYHP